MSKVEKWPPPAVKQLVKAQLPSAFRETAEWPSFKDVDEATRALARKLLDSVGSRELKDTYPILGISSRGALHIANEFSRVFGYGNPEIRFIGLSSYDGNGTQQTDEFLRGHIPLREDVEGQDLLLLDEVCHTGKSLVENLRILKGLGATSVTTAVLDYKPKQSQAATGFVPDFYVRTTEAWIVYPWEVYEHLGKKALDESIWRPTTSPW